MITLCNETSDDHSDIDQLIETGFGPDRHRLTVYRLRLAPPNPALGFLARDRATVVGTLRFWPVLVGASTPALLLGPLAVASECQGNGIGKQLVRHGLDRVTAAGWRLCLVVGGPTYYAPFGFEPAAPWGLALPGPVALERFQARALDDAALCDLLPSEDRTVQPWRLPRRGGLSRPRRSRRLAA
jgi:predicted N-acetyltransferase YhbS